MGSRSHKILHTSKKFSAGILGYQLQTTPDRDWQVSQFLHWLQFLRDSRAVEETQKPSAKQRLILNCIRHQIHCMYMLAWAVTLEQLCNWGEGGASLVTHYWRGGGTRHFLLIHYNFKSSRVALSPSPASLLRGPW